MFGASNPKGYRLEERVLIRSLFTSIGNRGWSLLSCDRLITLSLLARPLIWNAAWVGAVTTTCPLTTLRGAPLQTTCYTLGCFMPATWQPYTPATHPKVNPAEHPYPGRAKHFTCILQGKRIRVTFTMRNMCWEITVLSMHYLSVFGCVFLSNRKVYKYYFQLARWSTYFYPLRWNEKSTSLLIAFERARFACTNRRSIQLNSDFSLTRSTWQIRDEIRDIK